MLTFASTSAMEALSGSSSARAELAVRVGEPGVEHRTLAQQKVHLTKSRLLPDERARYLLGKGGKKRLHPVRVERSWNACQNRVDAASARHLPAVQRHGEVEVRLHRAFGPGFLQVHGQLGTRLGSPHAVPPASPGGERIERRKIGGVARQHARLQILGVATRARIWNAQLDLAQGEHQMVFQRLPGEAGIARTRQQARIRGGRFFQAQITPARREPIGIGEPRPPGLEACVRSRMPDRTG